MNIENFKLVREHVSQNNKFDMFRLNHKCGSPGCIMGSAQDIILELRKLNPSMDVPVYMHPDSYLKVRSTYVQQWLGISDWDFDYILLGNFSKNTIHEIKVQEAIAYLDLCINRGWVVRGEFEWPHKGDQS